jgi:magnesium chelatase family protein
VPTLSDKSEITKFDRTRRLFRQPGALNPPASFKRPLSQRFGEEAAKILSKSVRRGPHHDVKTNCNARMNTKDLKQHCKLDADSHDLIRVAMSELNLSARAYDRILKVARTIADLSGADAINSEHVSEAIQYRTFDRTLWI